MVKIASLRKKPKFFSHKINDKLRIYSPDRPKPDTQN